MPELNENSKRRSRYVAIAFAFAITSIAHAFMVWAAVRILNNAGAIAWTLEWRDSVGLGLIAVAWRMWLRNRD